MEKIVYPKLKETLYKKVMPNGLTVILLPKKDFYKTYGLFTTNYGSIDNEFVPLGQNDLQHVPDGIAHFLEHKMFEKEDGDIFQTFSRQGASANAFTSFTRTSYLFSTTASVNDNLTTLLDFVQQPYFTKATVEKEKGIIGQEIQMYQDDPNWRLFFGLLENLYPNHPLSIDIAGTIESIAEITAEDLYTCYNTFYHPSNMNLLVVGNIDVEETMSLIEKNQAAKNYPEAKEIVRHLPESGSNEIIKENQIQMAVNRSKAILGIKGVADLPSDDFEKMKFKLTVNLLLQLLLGNTSQNYLRLYDEGLIDDSFGFEFSMDRGFYFADFSADTNEPTRFTEEVKQILKNIDANSEINEANLELLKKKMLGKFLQSLNSLEYIANQFSQNVYEKVTLFDTVEAIESIQLTDILTAAKDFIKEENMSCFYIYSLEDK